MKNTLKYIALLSVTVITATAATESLGLAVSSLWGYHLPFAAFVSALVLQSLHADYLNARQGYEPRAARVVMLPADELFDSATGATGQTTSSWVARHHRVRRQLAVR